MIVFVDLTADEVFPAANTVINVASVSLLLLLQHLSSLLPTPLSVRVDVAVKGLEPVRRKEMMQVKRVYLESVFVGVEKMLLFVLPSVSTYGHL